MNGFFSINKPFGISSAKAVWLVKKKFNLKDKIGHMGTLDPNATGVLVVGIGRANRLFDVMQNKQKTYVAEFTFGFETETLDLESEVILQKSDTIPTKEQVENMIKTMIGKQSQVAPIFSAKSIDGKRAYLLARQGKSANIKPHEIEIFDFKLLSQTSQAVFQFEITCSSGTYIRSICRDLAYKLNSVATMTALKRTKCGPFLLENAKTIEEITENDLTPNDFALGHLKTLNLTPLQVQKIKNGIKQNCDEPNGFYKIYDEKVLIGIAKVQDGVASIPTWLI